MNQPVPVQDLWGNLAGTDIPAPTLTSLRIKNLLDDLSAYREAEGRSPRARALAVTITELEKVYAYFHTFVLPGWLEERAQTHLLNMALERQQAEGEAPPDAD